MTEPKLAANKFAVIFILIILAFVAVFLFFNDSRQEPSPNTSTGDNQNIVRSGTYTCSKCTKAQNWHITDKHLMYWDGQPYIPVGAADFDFERVSSEITEIILTIDEDKIGAMTEAEYFKEIDLKTNNYIAAGKTYILIISYPFPKNNAEWLFDEKEVSTMTAKWKQYAPLVRKKGLRAISLFNEINWEWAWPDNKYIPEEYGLVLGRLSDQAQQIFGEVPVFYKTAATGGGFKNVYSGAVSSDGLGFDFYARSCSPSGFDSIHNGQLNELKTTLSNSSKQLGLLWIAENGKRSNLSEKDLEGLPLIAGYESYASKEELKCYMDRLIEAGSTGFLMGMGYVPSGNKQVYSWYSELKPYIEQQVLRKSGTAN